MKTWRGTWRTEGSADQTIIHLHTLSDILLLRSGKWKSARPPAHDWLLVLSFHSGVSICRVVKLQNKTFRTQEWDQGFSVSVTDSLGKILILEYQTLDA